MNFYILIFYLIFAVCFTVAAITTHKAYIETKRFYGIFAFVWWLIIIVEIMQMITG